MADLHWAVGGGQGGEKSDEVGGGNSWPGPHSAAPWNHPGSFHMCQCPAHPNVAEPSSRPSVNWPPTSLTTLPSHSALQPPWPPSHSFPAVLSKAIPHFYQTTVLLGQQHASYLQMNHDWSSHSCPTAPPDTCFPSPFAASSSHVTQF